MENLLISFANRISATTTTGYSTFELVFGQPPILPVDLELETSFGIDWDSFFQPQGMLH
jgi:hypothetical protein